MNPFTRFLAQWIGSKGGRLENFIARWDSLERLVVRVYKSDTVTLADRRLFGETWPWLREEYGHWAVPLASYWQETLVGGIPAPQDPFLFLLNIAEPKDICGNWEAMQYLPAAREALNRMLVAGRSR